MRCALMLALVALSSAPLTAQENEAEKLFRGVAEKLRSAKSLQLRFDATITDALGKKGTVKGALVLGEGDKLRVEAEGKLFGEESKFTTVSDGADMKSFGYTKTPGQPKKEMNETEKSPKGVGVFFRAALPRDGAFWCVLNMNRRSDMQPDRFTSSDFKLGGKERVGDRNTSVIQYTVKAKGKSSSALSMKLWIDVQTHLPVKLAMTGGGSDISDITETYREFTIDGKVDAKSFELPK